MTKLEAYRVLSRMNSDTSWIANVFLTSGGGNSANSLKAMVTLIQAGHEICSLSFTMPYERLLIDGIAKTPEEMRNMAARIKAKDRR